MVAEKQRSAGTAPVGVLVAVRRHWIVALLPVILFVGIAVWLGRERAPRYTATTHLTVSRIYVDNPAGVAGVIEATRSLASIYSRAVFSSRVRDDTARRVGEDALRGSDQLSATQIPESPLIRLSVESSSERRAVALANAASAALGAYVKRHERSDEADVILARYRRAERDYRKQTELNRRLARRYDRDPSSKNEAAIDRAAVDSSSARLRRNALRQSYEAAVQGRTSPPSIEVFSRATSATSDRVEKLQVMVLLGLIAGISAGVALALLREYRKARRRSYV